MKTDDTAIANTKIKNIRGWIGGWGSRILMVGILASGTLSLGNVARAEMAKTAADNQTLVQTYKDKVTAFRKEAQDHRAAAKEYRHGDNAFDASGHANAWALRIATQHEKMAADADRMAADADKLVDFLQKLGKDIDKK